MNEFVLEEELDRIATLELQQRELSSTLAQLESHLQQTKDKLQALREAQAFVQSLCEQIQRSVHAKLAGLVTTCLSDVFDRPYTFRLDFSIKRGRTAIKLCLERDGVVVTPMEAAGGGVVDVASFALRIACLLMSKPRVRNLLFLDEPFKFVSESYRPAVVSLLEQLAENLGLQIILVTHIPELRTGQVIMVERNGVKICQDN